MEMAGGEIVGTVAKRNGKEQQAQQVDEKTGGSVQPTLWAFARRTNTSLVGL